MRVDSWIAFSIGALFSSGIWYCLYDRAKQQRDFWKDRYTTLARVRGDMPSFLTTITDSDGTTMDFWREDEK